jgi:hypothetical protein
VVAQLELDALTLGDDLEILDQLGFDCLGNGFSSLFVAGQGDGVYSGLQVAVHEVDLLQTAKALADVLRTYLPYSLNRFELGVRGGQ